MADATMGNAQTQTGQFAWSDTHPFISFSLRLDRLSPETWALLGECSSKIEHICRIPMRPDTAHDLFKIFLAKGVHGTTAIEGNTLSEEQVALQIKGELRLPPSQAYLGNEVDNTVKAYVWLIDQIKDGTHGPVCAEDLKRMNTLVLEGLEVADAVVPGEFRDHVVGVKDYKSPSPAHTPALVDRLCTWMNDPEWRQTMGPAYVIPILQAIVVHLYIAWIHPFGDGNGRTARLMEFDILTRAGVPPISAHVLSDHYNKTRAAYYRALSASRRDPTVFVSYAVQGFVDGQREQLDRIWVQQTQVTWINYVHERFGKLSSHGSVANHRRRSMAIALGIHGKAIPWKDIPKLQSELAASYGASQRMLQRDVNELEAMELVIRRPGEEEVSANLKLLQTFLPLKGTPPNATTSAS